MDPRRDDELREEAGGEGEAGEQAAVGAAAMKERYGGWRVTGIGLLYAIVCFACILVLMRSAASSWTASLDQRPTFHGGEQWFVLGLVFVGMPLTLLLLLLVFVLFIPQSYLTRFYQFRVGRTVAAVIIPLTLVFGFMTGFVDWSFVLAVAIPTAVALALFLGQLNKSLPR